MPPLGLVFPEVRLEPYDPAWPQLYAEERERILAAVGDALLGIEHVGSTSVPGMCAKPMLDIAVAVPSFEAAEALAPRLETLGYLHVPDAGVPGERTFARGRPARTHLLHAVVAGSREWRNYLSFRDTLRTDPRIAREYDALKRRLAEQFASDRPRYTSAKNRFIKGVLGEGP